MMDLLMSCYKHDNGCARVRKPTVVSPPLSLNCFFRQHEVMTLWQQMVFLSSTQITMTEWRLYNLKSSNWSSQTQKKWIVLWSSPIKRPKVTMIGGVSGHPGVPFPSLPGPHHWRHNGRERQRRWTHPKGTLNLGIFDLMSAIATGSPAWGTPRASSSCLENCRDTKPQ